MAPAPAVVHTLVLLTKAFCIAAVGYSRSVSVVAPTFTVVEVPMDVNAASCASPATHGGGAVEDDRKKVNAEGDAEVVSTASMKSAFFGSTERSRNGQSTPTPTKPSGAAPLVEFWARSGTKINAAGSPLMPDPLDVAPEKSDTGPLMAAAPEAAHAARALERAGSFAKSTNRSPAWRLGGVACHTGAAKDDAPAVVAFTVGGRGRAAGPPAKTSQLARSALATRGRNTTLFPNVMDSNAAVVFDQEGTLAFGQDDADTSCWGIHRRNARQRKRRGRTRAEARTTTVDADNESAALAMLVTPAFQRERMPCSLAHLVVKRVVSALRAMMKDVVQRAAADAANRKKSPTRSTTSSRFVVVHGRAEQPVC